MRHSMRKDARYEHGKKSQPREEEDSEKTWAGEDEEYLRLKEKHRRRNE